jgi:hypothetical protein
MSRFLPVIVLVLLAPVVAELLYGTISVTQATALLFVLPIYGAGALLIREVVRRSERGWGSILLLGAAYGVIEEGLVLQSFFNPTLYRASEWGARLFGVNWVYVEAMLVLHAVWSIAIPIVLTELLFPSWSRKPYLGRFGLVVTTTFYILGVGLLMLSTHTSLAPGYWAPPVLLSLCALTVLVLVVVALGTRPKEVSLRQAHAPQPWVPFLTSGLGGFAYLALLILLWRAEPIFAHSPWVLLPMLSAMILVAGVAGLLRHWSRSYDWGDRHLLALASGALIAHTLVGILDPGVKDRIGLAGLEVILVVLLVLFAILVHHRLRRNADVVKEHAQGSTPNDGKATI